MAKINISGIDKARLLQALHNGTACLGMGKLHDIGSMTLEQAQHIIDTNKARGVRNPLAFDYCCGRPLKTDIGGDEMDTWGYDRDSSDGHAAVIVEQLRKEMAEAK